MNSIENKYLQAVEQIKTAILQSQYKAIRLANQEQLKTVFQYRQIYFGQFPIRVLGYGSAWCYQCATEEGYAWTYGIQ